MKRVEQPEFSKEEGREGAPTSRDQGDDQLSEYDDDSSDNDSDDFAVEEDGAITKCINAVSKFIALNLLHVVLIFQILVNFSGVEF